MLEGEGDEYCEGCRLERRREWILSCVYWGEEEG
jgi:hypothetical protein